MIVVLTIGCLALLALGILWTGYALFAKLWPSAAATPTGQTVGKIVDKTQDWSALAALRAIRWMDEIESNPTALSAWEVLYDAIGGTPYSPDDTAAPGTTSTIPAASAPHVVDTASEIHFTPKG